MSIIYPIYLTPLNQLSASQIVYPAFKTGRLLADWVVATTTVVFRVKIGAVKLFLAQSLVNQIVDRAQPVERLARYLHY